MQPGVPLIKYQTEFYDERRHPEPYPEQARLPGIRGSAKNLRKLPRLQARTLMTQQLLLDLLLPSLPTLENYVVGNNGAAVQALMECRPGRAVYLWGAPGSGRTHLLHALGSAEQAAYYSAAQANGTLQELATSDTFTVRTVAVDDVDQLDANGQAALFALYNRWRETASTDQAFILVLAGSHAPVAMPVREDLRTRLGWDLVFRLEQLSDENRAQALQTRAHERGLSLSPEVISWVLTHYERDMSRLSALVDALDRYSLERHRAITLPLLKDLLASNAQPRITS